MILSNSLILGSWDDRDRDDEGKFFKIVDWKRYVRLWKWGLHGIVVCFLVSLGGLLLFGITCMNMLCCHEMCDTLVDSFYQQSLSLMVLAGSLTYWT